MKVGGSNALLVEEMPAGLKIPPGPQKYKSYGPIYLVGRIIAISSGKGGVGKTTLCANLAAALSELGKSVIVVDANLSTSNLGMHLGIPLYPKTLQDVLKGRVRLKDAIYHHPAGFKIIPADVSVRELMVPRKGRLVDVFLNLAESTDFVLIDSAAGLGAEAGSALEAAEEMIAVTNPEMPALTDALKLLTVAGKHGTGVAGVVVNRVRKERHEVGLDEIEEFLEMPVLGVVHEDRKVREAISRKVPVVLHKPKARSSKQMREIAIRLAGEPRRKGFWERVFGNVE